MLPQSSGSDRTGRQACAHSTCCGVALSQGLIYAVPEASIELQQEKNAFPSKLLDVLDETEKALSWMQRPANAEEVELAEETDIDFEMSLVENDNIFGYVKGKGEICQRLMNRQRPRTPWLMGRRPQDRNFRRLHWS